MKAQYRFAELGPCASGEYRHYRVGGVQSVHVESIEGKDVRTVTYELVETHRRELGGPLRKVER